MADVIDQVLADLAAEQERKRRAAEEEDKGVLLSAAEWFGRSGYAIRNAMDGNVEGALRQVADIGGDFVDAALPGDWIPAASRRDTDYTEVSDLLGGMEPGWEKTAVDILGGIATDPLSYVSFGATGALAAAAKGATVAKGAAKAAPVAAKVGGGVGLGIPFTKFQTRKILEGRQLDPLALGGRAIVAAGREVLPEGAKTALANAGRKVKATFGAQALSPSARALAERAAALRSNVERAQVEGARPFLDGVSQETAQDAFRVINDLVEQGGRYSATGVAAVDPRLATVPASTGAPASVLGSVDPAAAFAQVKAPGASRTVGPLDSDLGIEGVSTGAERPFIYGLEQERIIPTWADDAAGRALEQAYPLQPTAPRFANGIDLANRSLKVPGAAPSRIRSYEAGDIPASASELATAATGQDEVIRLALDAAANPVPRPLPLSQIDLMLGAAKPVAKELGSTPMPASTINRMSELMGAPAAESVDVAARELPGTGARFADVDTQLATLRQRVAAMPWDDARKAQVMRVVEQVVPYTQAQFRRSVESGAYSRPMGVDLARESPVDYVQRKFTSLTDEADQELIQGGPTSIKERVLPSGKPLADYLNEGAGKVKLEEDLNAAILGRAREQGELEARALVGKELVGKAAERARAKQLAVADPLADKMSILSEAERKALEANGKALADSDFRGAMTAVLDDMAKTAPEDAQVLRDLAFGMPPRGAITGLLARTLRPFKGPAVYGFIIPKIGSVVRNLSGGIVQTMANAEAAGKAGTVTKQFVPNFIGTLGDGIEQVFGTRLGLANDFAEIDTAFRASGGDVNRAVAGISNPTLREAVQTGVLDNGFVSTERLVEETRRSGWRKWYGEARDLPGKMFQGAEQRLRYGLFKALRSEGRDPEDAARIVSDTFYSYRISSQENRLARDLIPFFQFPAKAIPQMGQALSRNPAAMVGLNGLFAQDTEENQLYPFMEGRANIPLGKGEDGNPQYLSGLGLPFEALNSIPDFAGGVQGFGRDIERDILGSSNPLLKTAYAAISGRDPFFGSAYGSYDRVPIAGSQGAAGRAYNQVAATGLIQPIDSLLRTVGGMTDDRKSGGAIALDMLTGANVVSVDPDRARAQELLAALERNPEARQSKFFYATDDTSPEVRAMIAELVAAKKASKAKRAAAVPANPGD